MLSEKSGPLGPEELAGYQRDGFVVRHSVLSQQECATWVAQVARAQGTALASIDLGAHEGEPVVGYTLDDNRFFDLAHITVQLEHDDLSGAVRVIEPIQDLIPAFNALIDDARLTAPMQQLVRDTSLSLWTAKLNVKSARSGSGFAWHQDAPYWTHDSDHVARLPNVMVLFEEATLENGCLRIIRGSHDRGLLPGCEDGRQLQGFYTHLQAFSNADEVALAAPAGSLIFFDPFCVHGSGPNLTDRGRSAVILTYQPGGYPTLKSRVLRPVVS